MNEDIAQKEDLISKQALIISENEKKEKLLIDSLIELKKKIVCSSHKEWDIKNFLEDQNINKFCHDC